MIHIDAIFWKKLGGLVKVLISVADRERERDYSNLHHHKRVDDFSCSILSGRIIRHQEKNWISFFFRSSSIRLTFILKKKKRAAAYFKKKRLREGRGRGGKGGISMRHQCTYVLLCINNGPSFPSKLKKKKEFLANWNYEPSKF